jgi:hypothetical protein
MRRIDSRERRKDRAGRVLAPDRPCELLASVFDTLGADPHQGCRSCSSPLCLQLYIPPGRIFLTANLPRHELAELPGSPVEALSQGINLIHKEFDLLANVFRSG